MLAPPPPFVLTLKLDQRTFAVLDELRAQYFPPARNIVPAHITLFHALPGDQEAAIQQTLHDACSTTAALHLDFPGLRFLGRGVALEVAAPALSEVRGRLAASWSDWLTPQDRRGYRPHVTIQNKVAPDDARRLFDQLAATWTPFRGRGEGLLLWRYIGGPWEFVREFTFSAR